MPPTDASAMHAPSVSDRRPANATSPRIGGMIVTATTVPLRQRMASSTASQTWLACASPTIAAPDNPKPAV